MAAGEYVSVASQSELAQAEIELERNELAHRPEAEQEELAETFERRGLSKELATEVARELSRDPEHALEVHVREELGLDVHELPSPGTAGVSSFLSFSVGALIPLLPYLLGAESLLACSGASRWLRSSASACWSHGSPCAPGSSPGPGSCCSVGSPPGSPTSSVPGWAPESADADHRRVPQTVALRRHQTPTVADPAELPSRIVHLAVVGAAQQHEVVQRCAAALGPVHDMVRLGPCRRSVAALRDTAAGRGRSGRASGDRAPCASRVRRRVAVTGGRAPRG